ncbi:hypothetical protein DPQ25_03435 [Hydrogeniiclostridium mannosilyticum]|uniref:Uncharacterized protein n=1 Tax=Hydrogeniiclostridium mannosilyticum TaxID=2764322 RepID=A0A328UM44_9FIRM|nr:hypothetical protein DPQ25_03435 [Hydrogeniiclostridium mannosilyticum]
MCRRFQRRAAKVYYATLPFSGPHGKMYEIKENAALEEIPYNKLKLYSHYNTNFVQIATL